MADPAPGTVWLELTQRCQLRCGFCYNDWRFGPAAGQAGVSDAVLDWLHDQLARHRDDRRLRLVLAGGDPTAHPALADIALRFGALVPVTIVTHGAARRLAADMARLAGGPIDLQLSIPSFDAADYRRITGGGDLSRVAATIAAARAQGVPFGLSVAVGRHNLDVPAQTVAAAVGLGAGYCLLNRLRPSGNGNPDSDRDVIGAAPFARFVAAARAAAAPAGLPVTVVGLPSDATREAKARHPQLCIGVDGRVSTCNFVRNTVGEPLGDLGALFDQVARHWREGGSVAGCHCSTAEGPGARAVGAAENW